MQAATSDVNAAVLTLRTHLINAQSFLNPLQARHAIYALNEILPPQLRLVFDTELYREATSPTYLVPCKACTTDPENPVTTKITKEAIRNTRPAKVYGKWGDYLSTLNAKVQLIRCDTCGKDIPIHEKEVMARVNSDFADKYLPAEPQIGGIFDRALNQDSYWEWVTICHATLERKFREFRELFLNRESL